MLHCLVVSFCKDSGFVMLEELSDGTFERKYMLDSAGNALAIELFEEELDRGDRAFSDTVVVSGTVTSTTIDGIPVLETQSLKIVSLSDNSSARSSRGYAAKVFILVAISLIVCLL